MQFSVILPFVDMIDMTAEALESVLGNTKKPCEVILMHAGTADPFLLLKMLDEAGVSVIYRNSPVPKGAQRAISQGFAYATGDIKVLVPNDAVVNRFFFECTEKIFNFSGAGLLVASISQHKELVKSINAMPGTSFTFELHMPYAPIESTGCLLCVKREFADRVLPFPDELQFWGELYLYDMAHALGLNCYRMEENLIYHQGKATFGSLLSDYGNQVDKERIEVYNPNVKKWIAGICNV
jgi:hypothetical protein